MKGQNEDMKILCAGYISRKIKQAREAKGWTRYKLAQVSGVNFGHISRIEDGWFVPRTDTIHKLCVALEIELKVPLPI